MDVIFYNHTKHTVYIAILDYDQETKYLSEPIIFELDTKHEYIYKTTSQYFLSSMINCYCKNRLDFYSVDTNYQWYSSFLLQNLEKIGL
jgi:hypothetical protein